MIEFFLQLDYALTNGMSSIFPQNTFFDYIFLFLSLNGLTIIVWGIMLVLFMLFEVKNPKQFLIFFLLSFLSTWLIVNVVIKNIIQRDRPYIANQIDTLYCPEDFSFPSGHASSAFAGAVIFAYFDKKRKWIYYSVAGLISLSRIYLHCHYFFDVFVGAYIGYIVSKVYLLYLPDNKKI